MGLILSSIYQKGDSLISEISIKNYTKESLSQLENARIQWGIVHWDGTNLEIKTEGSIATLSAEFNQEAIDSANLFPIFITNVMEGEPVNIKSDHGDEDS
jgi:hypothetical protein